MGIGDAIGRLHDGLEAAAGCDAQCLNDQLPTHLREFVVQTGRGVDAGNRQAFGEQHVARIQPSVHLHDGDAGLRIARFDGAVNRRCAAPARQQAGVNIEAAKPRLIQHPLRQDQAISRNDHHLRTCGFDLSFGSSRLIGKLAIQAQASGLRHGDAVLQRKLFHGRGLQFHAAPGRAVRLREHQSDLKTSAL